MRIVFSLKLSGGTASSVYTTKWLVKGISTPLPEIINCTKQKLVKEKIKKYINGCY